jgi:hypothetical protein
MTATCPQARAFLAQDTGNPQLIYGSRWPPARAFLFRDVDDQVPADRSAKIWYCAALGGYIRPWLGPD